MARRKKTKSSTKSKRRWPEWNGPAMKRGLIAALWLIGLIGVGALWTLGVPRLEAYADSALATEEISITFRDRPAWLHDELANELKHLARRQLLASPFDREGLVGVHEALSLTGWFANVARIERTTPNQVVITAQFRTPFAVVQDQWGAHLVDRSGFLLPQRYPKGAEPALLPVLARPFAARPPSPGDQWPGPDIQAGLDLAELLMTKPWFEQVAVIDLAEFARTEAMWLTTRNNARILWGRAPGNEVGAEVPAEQKLRYLDYFNEQYNAIDRGLSSLDITHDKVYAHD